jgi:Bacterial toxin 44
LRGNISEMERRTRLNPLNWFWFKRQVQNKGPWDYKQDGVAEANMFWGNKWNRYWAGGNFHYGATAAAFGVPDQVILRMAGVAAWKDRTSPPNSNWIFTPYGDDPWDQHWIQAGIDSYRCSSGR